MLTPNKVALESGKHHITMAKKESQFPSCRTGLTVLLFLLIRVLTAQVESATPEFDNSDGIAGYDSNLVDHSPYAWAKYKAVKIDNQYGFIDGDSNLVIAAQFDIAYDFSEGLAAVGTVERGFSHQNARYGFINSSANLVIEEKYEAVGRFREGLCRTRIFTLGKPKWLFIDYNDSVKLRLDYHEVRDFHEARARVSKQRRAYFIIFPYLVEYWGYIDKRGTEVIPLVYDNAGDFSNGLANVETDGKKGYINRDGDEVIPLRFDYLGFFCEGLAFAAEEDTFGFIDTQGNWVIPPQYEAARSFSQGRALVQLKGKWIVINRSGENVLPDNTRIGISE
jgi:hypothetical protein